LGFASLTHRRIAKEVVFMSPRTQGPSPSAAPELEVETNWSRVLLVAGLSLGFLVVPLIWSSLRTDPGHDSAPGTTNAPRTPALAEYARTFDKEPVATPPQPVPPSPSVLPVPATDESRGVRPAVVAQTFPVDRQPAAPARAVESPAAKTEAPAVTAASPAESEQPAAALMKSTRPSALRAHFLYHVPEIGLNPKYADPKTLLAKVQELHPRSGFSPRGEPTSFATFDPAELARVSTRPGALEGLAFRKGKECQVDAKTAAVCSELSRHLTLIPAQHAAFRLARERMQKHSPYDGHGLPVYEEWEEQEKQAVDERTLRFLSHRNIGPSLHGGGLLTDETAPTLAQVLQVERPTVRIFLVKTLATVKGPNTTAALAQRAVFDSDPEVREAAVKALKSRPAADYRQTLVKALRYPWAPVAERAGEALSALQDQDAVPALVRLLDEPDPAAPFVDRDEIWKVTEMVKVNHLQNCVLCHAPSTASSDALRGFVPTPGREIPNEYYHSGDGSFIRADITYLKQDFSEKLPVANAQPWPEEQRFDFLLRTRDLTGQEVVDLKVRLRERGPHGSNTPYPQREAVLRTLRQLTGVDCGGRREDWQEFDVFPEAD
jgi:hypothetical protein